MKWAIQATHTNQHMANDVCQAVRANGGESVPVWLDKQATELPEIDASYDEGVIFYGSVHLVRLAAAQRRYRPGVFFVESCFEYDYHIDLNGKKMLNDDAKKMYLGDVLSLDPGFFVRPLGDLKWFAGRPVKTEDDIAKLWPANDRSMMEHVLVSTLKPIRSEYRCFVVDGVLVSAAQYRPEREAVSDDELPDIKTFLDGILYPEAIVAADVARMEDGSMRLIEFNCFNCSGFYRHHDIGKVVSAVNGLF